MKKNYNYKINEHKEIFIEILKNILFNDKCFFVYDIFSKTLLFIFLFWISIIDKNNTRTLLLRKSKKFMDLCLKKSLIKYNFNEEINNPKISVIIPIYNCENTIKIVISSIQNQNISDFEIILVNDFSKDNSLKIIKGLSLEDSRIKILNNNKNMGTLYSRCIGVLISNGAYTFPLDNDDLFMDDDVFDVIVKESEKGNYDIVGFNAIRGPNYKPRISDMEDDIYHDNPDNLILNQPELGIHSITKNGKYDINNIHIWGKCIKKYIYEKTINALGEKKYKQFMSWAEDTSMVFALFNIANSYKFISKYGVFHLMSKKTACYTQPDENKLFGEIFLLDTIYDFSKNDFQTKKYVVMKTIEISRITYFKKAINNTKNSQYLKDVIKKLVKCKYISKIDKSTILSLPNYKDWLTNNHLFNSNEHTYKISFSKN